MAIRMKDIAREVGVSVVTVSKVLHNQSDISEETRKRVLRVMREMNYQPNLAARALVTGRTYMIGLVVPDLLHPFFAQVAKGLSRVLRKKGYGVVISSSEEDAELERQEIRELLARRVDALVVASTQPTADALRRIEEERSTASLILIDRKLPGFESHFVGVDDEEVGRLATEHLFEQGCRRIAHICGPEISTSAGRAKGLRDVLARHGLELEPGYVIRGPSADAAADISGYSAMQRLLALSPRPDGVFCFNDPTAVGAMQAVLEAGLRIPEDIAFVGCGNVLYSGFLRVPLSSVDQDSEGIGERAAKLALSVLSSKRRPKAKTVLLTPSLVVRESSARQPAGSAYDPA